MNVPEAREDALVEAATPVHDDAPEDAAKPGVALCLSGGGYRAMLFHLGALWRLNELGWLPKLDRVSSVSGGSITAGVLARNWNMLGFDGANVAQGFERAVVDPIRGLAGETLDVFAGLRGIFLPGSIADKLADSYDNHLFDGATLQDLPERPRFVFNATNLQSGVLWRFSKPYMWDYRVGKIEKPKQRLAVAVAASSAFPPFLSPLRLKLSESDYVPNTGDDLQTPEYMTHPALSDGGVYDNLGLETAWKRYDTILVSDGGGHFSHNKNVKTNWPLQARLVLGVIDSQVRAMRKKQLIGGLKAGLRKGAYWGIWSEIAKFGLDEPLDFRDDAAALARTPTRLAKTDPRLQERIVNWGYAICDTAMRRWVVSGTPKPTAFPYPAERV